MLLMTLPLMPSDGELAILRVLWSGGPATVRAVHDALERGGAYTTTLKQLQIMWDKGLVTRDDSQRSHVYGAAVKEDEVQGSLVTDLLRKAFDGSAARLAMRALSVERASDDEIAELRSLLDRLDGEDDR